jgi:hypothetical protein
MSSLLVLIACHYTVVFALFAWGRRGKLSRTPRGFLTGSIETYVLLVSLRVRGPEVTSVRETFPDPLGVYDGSRGDLCLFLQPDRHLERGSKREANSDMSQFWSTKMHPEEVDQAREIEPHPPRVAGRYHADLSPARHFLVSKIRSDLGAGNLTGPRGCSGEPRSDFGPVWLQQRKEVKSGQCPDSGFRVNTRSVFGCEKGLSDSKSR